MDIQIQSWWSCLFKMVHSELRGVLDPELNMPLQKRLEQYPGFSDDSKCEMVN